jgi:hypothetical protein
MLQPDPNERFRMRRQRARRHRAVRRTGALAVVAVTAAVLALGARFLEEGDHPGPSKESAPAATSTAAEDDAVALPQQREMPAEIRGVHVTMALLSLPGKLDEYLGLARKGATAIEIDVKDENGDVAFSSPYAPLAKKIGTARDYYRPKAVVKKVHAAGLYLIGRVVVFEDPALTSRKPGLAIRHRNGGIWTNSGGLGWSNQYDERVWDYNLDIAEAAARAGFDEIMFDYIRFPTDGPIEDAVWPGRVNERKGETLARFLAYARQRLEPLGTRIGAAVFGLAATRDLGIGQRPRILAPYLDSIYPMVYPSHYTPGEYNIADPDASPRATVTMSLRYFRKALRGMPTRLVPWLQDFTLGHRYTLDEVEAQIAAARKLQSSGYLLWNAAGVYTDGGVRP